MILVFDIYDMTLLNCVETPLYPFGVTLLLMRCNINKANMAQNKVNL